MKVRILLVLGAGLLITAWLFFRVGAQPRSGEGEPELALGEQAGGQMSEHVASVDSSERSSPRDATPARTPAAIPASTVEAEPSAPGEDEAVGAPPSLRGRLVDEHGVRVTRPGSSVSLHGENGEGQSRTDLRDGEFEFQEVEPGRWWIVGDAPGYEETRREFSRSPGEAPIDLDLTLRRRPTVDVLLRTPAGAPFETGSFHFLPIVYSTRERLTSTVGLEPMARYECGKFHARDDLGLAPPQLGLLELTCDPPLWVTLILGSVLLGSQRIEVGTRELVFVLDPTEYTRLFASLRARTVDRLTGKPVAGVFARLEIGSWNSWMSTSERAGELHYEVVLPGPATLHLERAGFASLALEFDVPPGAQHDLGDVLLNPIGQGVLRLAIERPPGVDEVTVNWTKATEAAPTGWSGLTWGADEKSEIDLGSGKWLVWAEAVSDGRRFRSHDVEVDMQGGVVEESLALEALVRVVIEPSEASQTVAILDRASRASRRQTYILAGLPFAVDLVPGQYEFIVRSDAKGERRTSVSIGLAGGTVQLP